MTSQEYGVFPFRTTVSGGQLRRIAERLGLKVSQSRDVWRITTPRGEPVVAKHLELIEAASAEQGRRKVS